MSSANQNKLIKPQWFKPIGQFLEIFSVLVLTSLIGLFWSPTGSWRTFAAVAIIIVGLASLGLAIVCSYKAAEEDALKSTRAQQDANVKMHMISRARLAVLKDMGVPVSVRLFLETLISEPKLGKKVNDVSGDLAMLISGGELLTVLTEGLGPEIVKKFKASVLEHTLWVEEQTPADTTKPDAPQAPATVPSNNAQPSQLATGTAGAA